MRSGEWGHAIRRAKKDGRFGVDGQESRTASPLKRIASVDVDDLCEGAIDEVTDHAREALNALVRDYRFSLKKRDEGGTFAKRATKERIARIERDIEGICAAFGERLKAVDLDAIRAESEPVLELAPAPSPALGGRRPKLVEEAEPAPASEPVLDRASRLELLRRMVVNPGLESEPAVSRARSLRSQPASSDDEHAGGVARDLGEPLTPALRAEISEANASTTVTLARRKRMSVDSEAAPRPVRKPEPKLKEEDEAEENLEIPKEELLSNEDCSIAELHAMLMRHGGADDSDLHAYAEILGTAEKKILAPLIALSRFPALNQTKSIGALRSFIYHLYALFENATGRRDYNAQQCVEAVTSISARAKACGIDPEKIFKGRMSKLGGGSRVILDGSAGGESNDADVALYNMLRGMLKAPNFWRTLGLSIKKDLVEDMAAEDQKAEKEKRPSRSKDMERLVKGIYAIFLKRLSTKLHAREIRKTGEILHPKAIDTEDVERLADVIGGSELPANLWKQQGGGLEAVRRGFQQGEQYVYVDTPPGTGKTRILMLAAQHLNPNGNSVLLVPNLNLVEQHRRQAKQHGINLPVGIVSPHDAVLDQPLTIMTYQQMVNYIKCGLFKPDRFNLLLFDEVHETMGDARQEILQAFPEAKAIGATATGQDSMGKNVSDVFTCVYYISLVDGLRAGICNPVRLENIELPDCDLTYPDVEAKDLLLRQKEILKWYRKNCEGGQVLIMMSSNERAEAVARYFREAGGIKDASAIYGASGRSEIFRMNEQFHDGTIKVLVTAEYLVQGWDCSGLRNLALGDSPDLEWQAAQRVGRAIRRVTVTETDSRILQLRGGLARKRRPGLGPLLVNAPRPTALDRLFKIPTDFVSGSRIIEPEPGFWPRNAFKVAA